jgi:hypothetical protein
VLGPFAQLPEDVQLVATSILFHVDHFPSSLLRGLCVAYALEGVSWHVRQQMLSILSATLPATANEEWSGDGKGGGWKDEFVDFLFGYNFPRQLVDNDGWWQREGVEAEPAAEERPTKRRKMSSGKIGKGEGGQAEETSVFQNFKSTAFASLSVPILSRYLSGSTRRAASLCLKQVPPPAAVFIKTQINTRISSNPTQPPDKINTKNKSKQVAHHIQVPLGCVRREQHTRFKVHSGPRLQGWLGAGLLFAAVSLERAGPEEKQAICTDPDGSLQRLAQAMVAMFVLNQIEVDVTK